MFRDMENHKIEIEKSGSGHMLVYGKSGQGKTYFLCRMLERNYELGKKILIFDFSGSYSEKELQEKGFLYGGRVKRYILPEHNLEWNLRVDLDENFHQDVTDALQEALKCRGYFQKKLLNDAIGKIMKSGEKINFSSIMGELEGMLQEEQKCGKLSGNMENIERLLTRLSICKNIYNFSVKKGVTPYESIAPITIVDLTNYPESQRKFLTEFLVALIWHETYRQEFRNRCDIVFLDEMQFLSIREGSALSAMLREGRKKKLEIILSTQFVSHYSSEEIQALQQAGNIVIFCPTWEDCRLSAKMIGAGDVNAWEKILMKLQKGEAVLKGSYRIDNRKKLSLDPIIVKIEGK